MSSLPSLCAYFLPWVVPAGIVLRFNSGFGGWMLHEAALQRPNSVELHTRANIPNDDLT
jgi:hypothetical protein